MSYSKMLELIDEYLNSGELRNQEWFECLTICRNLIVKEMKNESK